jgi:hypothetical protein
LSGGRGARAIGGGLPARAVAQERRNRGPPRCGVIARRDAALRRELFAQTARVGGKDRDAAGKCLPGNSPERLLPLRRNEQEACAVEELLEWGRGDQRAAGAADRRARRRREARRRDADLAHAGRRGRGSRKGDQRREQRRAFLRAPAGGGADHRAVEARRERGREPLGERPNER